MPAPQPETLQLSQVSIAQGQTLALGVLCHTQEQIIDFGVRYDPLPIHTDPEAARKSIFGGIIASGAMLYMEAHRTWFVPLLGPSIICGLGVRNWNFIKPHYPDTPYHVSLQAREFIFNPDRPTVQVEWYYQFHTEDGVLVQDLELPVLQARP